MAGSESSLLSSNVEFYVRFIQFHYVGSVSAEVEYVIMRSWLVLIKETLDIFLLDIFVYL